MTRPASLKALPARSGAVRRLVATIVAPAGGGPRRLLPIAALLVATMVVSGCRDTSEYGSLLGTWQLDPETQEWLPRSCLVLDYEVPGTAALEIDRREEEYRVRLTDRRGTTFHGRVRDGVFDGRQLLPTSSTGRFCGSSTMVRLRLDLRGSDPDQLRGIWQTPDCDVCPDRYFGAERAAGDHQRP